jgi:hypothetical protein
VGDSFTSALFHSSPESDPPFGRSLWYGYYWRNRLRLFFGNLFLAKPTRATEAGHFTSSRGERDNNYWSLLAMFSVLG